MTDARIIIELLKTDPTAELMLASMDQSLAAEFPELRLSVEKTDDFAVGNTLEQGAELLLTKARSEALPWCVYVAPRRFDLIANGAEKVKVNGVFVAIARNQVPVALFVNTFTAVEVPDILMVAFSEKLDRIRCTKLEALEDSLDEDTIERFRGAVEKAYLRISNRRFFN